MFVTINELKQVFIKCVTFSSRMTTETKYNRPYKTVNMGIPLWQRLSHIKQKNRLKSICSVVETLLDQNKKLKIKLEQARSINPPIIVQEEAI